MNAYARPQSRKPNAASLSRWVPRLTLAAATAHMLMGAATSYPHWSDIISGGLWNTVPDDDDARMSTLWFMISGVAFFGIGLQARRFVIVTGRTPTETGWILLALGIPVSLLEPASGGWSLIAIGILAVWTSRRDRSSAASTY